MRSKFILIEQSLRDVGGHYFEYAREILHAAEAAGFEPVLATHRDFQGVDRLPRRWRVLPLFLFTSDKIHRIPSAYSFGLWRQIMASGGNLPAIASRVADAVSDRCKAAVSRLRWLRRMTRVRGFSAACQRLFEQCPLAAGDQVLCSTVSDMDFLGLVRFLRRHPDSAQAAWHLQFHFSVYCGRDPDYPVQDRQTRALRERMKAAIASVPEHRLHFYTTTDELGRQFNRLDVARFETLPWPVGEQFRASDGPRNAPAPAPAPLRVLCAGAVRREKGSDRLGLLARSLWDNMLQPRKIQLLFQLGSKRRWQKLTELPAGSFETAASIDQLPAAPLVSLPHPLQPDDYARMIQSADVGLLLYNADVYFARCSGILAELLAAGVPVIVPAGGWLAGQFAEENYRHLDELAARASHSQSISGPQSILSVPAGSSDAVIRLWRVDANRPGSYVRLAVEQIDADGKSLGRATKIVGHRSTALAAPVSALFHLAPGCASVRVAISSAYHKSAPVIEKASAAFLAAPASGEGHWPAGRVGLSFSDPAEIPRLLAELVGQHAHYRAGARAFASRWAEEHAALRTIEQIVRRSMARATVHSHAA
jgi:glycosyltransferase involved in cell wall biosynthesis